MPKLQLALPASSLDFLRSLQENNDREWFNAHKEEYVLQKEIMENFAERLLAELNKHDVIDTPSGKKSLHRIYKDTRFSKVKIPYKNNWGGNFARATKQRRGGYYYHIEPGNSFIGGGFQGPSAEDLKRLRDEFSADPGPLRKILEDKSFVETFGKIKGDQLKTTPKGFSPDNEAIDLLRYKQFLLFKRFTDEEVLAASFVEDANQVFKNMRPFFDYMTEVLTTDVNGTIIK